MNQRERQRYHLLWMVVEGDIFTKQLKGHIDKA
jgi:hypothetical protein